MIAVGGVYMSAVNLNPGLPQVAGGLGYGSWARIAQGKAIVGLDESDTDFQTAESTTGSKTRTPTGTVSQPSFAGTSSQATSAVSAGTPSGTVSQPTFTGDAITSVINHTHVVTITDPGHTHTQQAHSHTIPVGATDDTAAPFDRADAGTNASGANATTATGTATAVNNSATTGISATVANPAGGVTSITPTGAVSQPAFSGILMQTHSHTITPSGTVSQPTFTGNSVSVVQPSFVLYIWKRIS